MWVFEEPLFFNNFLRTQTLQSASLRASLRAAGWVEVGGAVWSREMGLEPASAREPAPEEAAGACRCSGVLALRFQWQ